MTLPISGNTKLVHGTKLFPFYISESVKYTFIKFFLYLDALKRKQFKVTPTNFYQISKISHICSIFRKSVCIGSYTYFETAQVLFSLCFRENGVKTLKIYE